MDDRDRSRFWCRVEQGANGCWQWVGGLRTNGYGTFAIRPNERWTQTTAHRFAYQDLVGPIPAGWEVDHLCRNRACVRPEHLEAVSLAENRRRRDVRYAPAVPTDERAIPVHPLPARVPKSSARQRPPAAPREPATHCRNGHEYAAVGWKKNGPGRACAGCIAERAKRRVKGNAAQDRTHCPQGHPYTEENTYWHARPGGAKHRECRACHLGRMRRR